MLTVLDAEELPRDAVIVAPVVDALSVSVPLSWRMRTPIGS
jgi:hypothetical protein